MIDSGNQMQPIDLNRYLIEHDLILGTEHVVAVTASLCQKLWDHREEYADFLIHGNHALPPMYTTNYPLYIHLLVVLLEDK